MRMKKSQYRSYRWFLSTLFCSAVVGSVFLSTMTCVHAQDAARIEKLKEVTDDTAQPSFIPTNAAPDAKIEKKTETADDASEDIVNKNVIDPCPTPENAIKTSPNDLAKVQEEIDRYTLCSERAQMLERYNESASKYNETIDGALGYQTAPNNGVLGLPEAQRNGLAPLPASALTDNTAADDPSTNVDAAQAPKNTEWTISQVYGSSNNLQAKLKSPDGDEIKVRLGSQLPDDAGTVLSITKSNVTIGDRKNSKKLEWANE
jgi:type IV pilus biogenesis protein PilP